ncbi:histidine phosphatase family protein [Nitratireductor aquimarinus]|uniref:Histidine phosphatase family protein n=1 Tax=Nitratireductor aquimarinus TaxID=889300 RepID=A0ABU4AN88_9HYPH|nr:histidine phosphatase family protein [Nitratireductor aquimarinus]MDV6227708.1 histidine phosphatase family protein [Nitratireductor aquimarinus]
MLPTLYIIRHGQTAWNAEERLQGQADTDINAVGQVQADRNGIRLADLLDHNADGFDFVASPLRRTRETMERVRAGLGLPREAYRTDPRLMELNFGDWQGFTYAELEAENPGCTAARSNDKWGFVPPGDNAESYEKLAKRIKPWLGEVKGPTVCVTHGGVIRSLLYLLGHASSDEAATLTIPQDRILRFESGSADWL